MFCLFLPLRNWLASFKKRLMSAYMGPEVVEERA